MQNLTLRVQLQPQKNTKCRPWRCVSAIRIRGCRIGGRAGGAAAPPNKIMEGQIYLFAPPSSKLYVDISCTLSANTYSCMLSHHIRTDPEQSSALVCVPVVTPRAQLEGVVLPAGRKNNRATFGPVGSFGPVRPLQSHGIRDAPRGKHTGHVPAPVCLGVALVGAEGAPENAIQAPWMPYLAHDTAHNRRNAALG